ncbi:FAD-binding domain-containing protein [Vulcanococcus limneticus]|uniref:FAD-binding domain-containing protein n=1 Tax=Vulcanococcus limneticus TaxID=2170428 RepID=UPI0036F3F995
MPEFPQPDRPTVPAPPTLQGVPLAWPTAAGDLPRQFPSRAALAAELQRQFPAALGPGPDQPAEAGLSPIPGGRRAAEARLAAIEPGHYGSSRNHMDGAVTRLSPYIRHGVLTLAEVRDAVFAWLQRSGRPRREAEKLINELGWRDYWQRLWRQHGEAIWHDLEPLKTGHAPSSYAAELPDDLRQGRTGLACIDGFSAELSETGWLHNHARMWLAAYVVHWRRVRWQAGARWFLQHLLDGDPASNNLSWQWVASCFSTKPYLFNRANLERYGGDRFCRGCRAAAAGTCPFEASYEQLQARLFGEQAPARSPSDSVGPPVKGGAAPAAALPSPARPVLWIHGEALGPANPALRAHPGRPALFVFDDALIAGHTTTTSGDGAAAGGAASPLNLKRLAFLQECLLELPVTIRRGDGAAELLAFAQRHGADAIVTSAGVDPRFEAIRARLAAALPVQVLTPEPFVALKEEETDLGRFGRYWRRAEAKVWAGFPGHGA